MAERGSVTRSGYKLVAALNHAGRLPKTERAAGHRPAFRRKRTRPEMTKTNFPQARIISCNWIELASRNCVLCTRRFRV